MTVSAHVGAATEPVQTPATMVPGSNGASISGATSDERPQPSVATGASARSEIAWSPPECVSHQISCKRRRPLANRDLVSGSISSEVPRRLGELPRHTCLGTVDGFHFLPSLVRRFVLGLQMTGRHQARLHTRVHRTAVPLRYLVLLFKVCRHCLLDLVHFALGVFLEPTTEEIPASGNQDH